MNLLPKKCQRCRRIELLTHAVQVEALREVNGRFLWKITASISKLAQTEQQQKVIESTQKDLKNFLIHGNSSISIN